MRQRPLATAYTNTREFFRAIVKHYQMADPEWTYKAWAKRLGLSSKSTLVMIVNGQRNPSIQLLERMTEDLGLTKVEKTHLLALLRIDKKTTDPVLRLMLLNAENGFSSDNRTRLWLLLVLKELIGLSGRKAKQSVLISQLSGLAEREEVDDHLSWLLQNGWIEKGADEGFRLATEIDIKGREFSQEQIMQFHQESHARSTAALRMLTPQVRAHKTSLLGVAEDQVPQLLAEISHMQKELTKKFDSKSGDKIYQISIQCFPVVELK